MLQAAIKSLHQCLTNIWAAQQWKHITFNFHSLFFTHITRMLLCRLDLPQPWWWTTCLHRGWIFHRRSGEKSDREIPSQVKKKEKKAHADETAEVCLCIRGRGLTAHLHQEAIMAKTAIYSRGVCRETKCAELLIGKRLRKFEGLWDLGAEGQTLCRWLSEK